MANMMKRGRLRMMEEGLASQITEFSMNFTRKDLEEVARSGSSLGSLKTAEQYSKDRELCLQKLLTIPQPKTSESQYTVMLEELELCLKPIYTVKNLPILLNQYYLDRLQELVQLKHMMLLRWTRLAIGRPKVTEELSAEYHRRLEYLMSEYNDTINRSRRLSDICSQHVISAHSVSSGDILPFLRWLVYHQHTTKKATAFTTRIQWLPLFYESEMVRAIQVEKIAADAEAKSPHVKQQPEITKKWSSAQRFGSCRSLLGYGQEKEAESQLLYPAPPTIASSLVECLDTGDTLVVGSQQMPFHQPDVTKNHTLLHELMLSYNIVGPSNFPSTSEELQFYYQVMRKFQAHFQAQENAIHFHTYDRLPEGENAKLSKSKLTFKKPPNWVPFIKIHPNPDPVQIKAFTKMKLTVPEVDPLLSLSSHCTHLHALQRVLYSLKQHSVVVRHPTPFTPLSVTSHKTPHDTLLVWKCIYSGLDSRNPLYTEDYVENPDSEEPADTPDMQGDTDEGDACLDMHSALKVILNNGGRNVSAKAKQVSKDAYLGFLLLRHLKIRDLRNKCLFILNFFNSVERTLTINTEGLSLEHNNDQRTKSSGLLDQSYLFKTILDYKVDQSDFMRYMEVENHDDFYAYGEDGSVQVWDMRGVAIMYESSLTHLKELEEELLTVATYYMRRVALRDR